MAIGDPYATVGDLTSYIFKQQETKAATLYTSDLTSALNSASQEIERHCNRQFNLATTVSARIYEPKMWRHVEVDDFATTTGLIVQTDPGGTGNFSVTWDPLDYELYPYNGVVAGVPGWPYSEIRAVRGLFFPKYAYPYRRRAVLQVTAQWGWLNVPAPVKQACLIMAAETWKLRDAPFGVAGFTQFGGAVKVRDNPMAASKLAPYVLDSVQVG